MKRKQLYKLIAGALISSIAFSTSVNAQSYDMSNVRVTNIGEQIYFIDSNGNKINGFIYNNGYVIYAKNGERQSGWVNDNNKWYYIDANCHLLTGLYKIGGKVYYFNAEGTMVIGTITFSNNHTLYTDNSGAIANFNNDSDLKLLSDNMGAYQNYTVEVEDRSDYKQVVTYTNYISSSNI